MEAGERAQQQVERLEAAVAEARRRLAHAEQQLHAWRQGADGERRTGEVLAQLEPAGWMVMHDLHWPGRPYANIDHIVIGPTGVFVIDSKNWSGNVEVRGGVLRQNGYARTAECEGVAAAAAAVCAYLEPQHRSIVVAVLCLVDRPTPSMQPQHARVLGLDDLAAALVRGTARLTTTEVATIAGYLRGLLDGPRSPELKTTAALSAAGTAPREQPRSHRRPSRQPDTRAPHYRSRVRRPRPSRYRSISLPLVKLALVAFVALVVLPAVLQGIARTASHAPTSTPPAVNHATPSPKPLAPKTAAHSGSTASR